MAKNKTLDDLVREVEENSGVMTVEASALRDRYGAERLGINVRNAISKELAGRGLAHYPKILPDRQHELVRIYRQGSPVADLIDAVLNVDSRADAKLRKAAKGDSEKVVAKIRELLEEA